MDQVMDDLTSMTDLAISISFYQTTFLQLEPDLVQDDFHLVCHRVGAFPLDLELKVVTSTDQKSFHCHRKVMRTLCRAIRKHRSKIIVCRCPDSRYVQAVVHYVYCGTIPIYKEEIP